MGLTPAEQAEWDALKAKAEVIEKPKTLADILHKIISFLGGGPLHDELHEAVDGLAENTPPPAPAPSTKPEPTAPLDTEEKE